MAKSKFRDKMHRYRTKSLFVEASTKEAVAVGLLPMFTLSPYVKGGLPSMRDHFIQSNDPTGYTTALAMLENWDHWQKIFRNKFFMEHLEVWQEEQAIKMRSEAIKSMHVTAVTEGSKGITAAKYIAEEGWTKKDTRPLSDRARAIHEDKKEKKAKVADHIEQDSARVLEMIKDT